MPTRSFGFSSVGPDVGRSARPRSFAISARQRRLAEPRRAVEQDVLERFVAAARRVDRDLEVVDDRRLADVLVERARPQRRADHFVFDRCAAARPRVRARPRPVRARRGASATRSRRGLDAAAGAIDLGEQRLGVARCGATRSVCAIIASASGRLYSSCSSTASASSAKPGIGAAPCGSASRISKNFVTFPCSFATMSRAFCWPIPGRVRRKA